MKTISIITVDMDLTKTSEGRLPMQSKVIGMRLLKNPEKPDEPNLVHLNVIVEHDVQAQMENKKFAYVTAGGVMTDAAQLMGQVTSSGYIYDVTAPAK